MIPFVPDFTLGYELKYTHLSTISSNTTTEGTGVDCQGYEGPIHAFGIVGNYGDASTVTVVKLQHSTDNVTFTDITGATTTLSASATANDNSTFMLRTDAWSKRYLRVALVTSGGTASVPVAVALFAKKKIGGGSGISLATYSA